MVMKKLLILIGIITYLTASTQTSDQIKQIDQLFSPWNNATPGVAVAIQLDGQTIYNKAFGLADLEHNIPNTTETIFESGSVAKQFTAMSILLLAADGKLAITDDIRKYVPEIPDYGTTITIQHLLNHTSGLKDWGSIGALSGWPRTTRVYTQDMALLIMSRQKSTNYKPGTEYSYSNANYSLLVTIVERVSGQSLATFTQQHLFQPLEMTHTQWRDNFRQVVPNRAIAYTKTSQGFEQLMPFENIHGHGGLLTTTGDLLKWNTLLATHQIGGDKVYQWRIQTGLLTNGQPITYASGLVVDQFNGTDQISHSGSTAGYKAWLAYYPQKKLSVVLLSNIASFNPVNVGHDIATVILGAPKQSPSAEETSIQLPAKTLKQFEGTYRSIRHYDVQKLEYKDGKVLSNDHEVKAAAPEQLYLDNRRWKFIRPGVILMRNNQDTMTYKKVLPPDLTNTTLTSIAGDYYSEEADVIYTITIKDNNLMTQIKPFSSIQLLPAFKDAFYEGSDLYEFIRDKKGKITGLLVSTGRAERVSFIKK